MTSSPCRAIFLDRDGVLNAPVVRNGKPYPPSTLADFTVLPDVPEALRILRTLDFRLCVVTNQPDVARGTQDRRTVEAMHGKLRSELLLTDYYVCYHDDADCCECRKPKPGLLLQAAAEHGISLPDSYMIGDRWRDVNCGHAAACKTIFIERGYNEQLREQPHFRAIDLLSAAGIIASKEGDS